MAPFDRTRFHLDLGAYPAIPDDLGGESTPGQSRRLIAGSSTWSVLSSAQPEFWTVGSPCAAGIYGVEERVIYLQPDGVEYPTGTNGRRRMDARLVVRDGRWAHG